jgi:hypothetical protein
MLEKLKDKLPMMGKKGKEMEKPSVEIEIGEDEEEGMPEEEGMGEEEEEVAVGKLAEFSDEELMEEMKKRGLEVASGGSSVLGLPELPKEEEEETA